MAPKWLPKRIKNRSKNMIDFLIDFEAVLEPPPLGEPPTREGGGIYASPLPPSTAPARGAVGGCPGGGGSKTASKTIKKSIIFLNYFSIRLGSYV